MFEYRFIRFQYHNEKNIFEPIVFNSSLPYNMIHENLSGGTSMKSDNAHKNYHVQRIRYGVCDILIPIDPLPKLLLREVLNPFYLFQIFSFSWWYWELYYFFASCLLFLSLVSLIIALWDTITNLKTIQKQAQYSCPVKVLRDGPNGVQTLNINSSELVPGDIVEIPEQGIMPCDLILLKGTAVMNESMLTGESIPAIKNSIPATSEVYDRVKDAKYTLYGGTKVVQTRKAGSDEALGLVIRTGFLTTKGSLIRDILYPRPNRFSFYRDSLLYIIIFGVLAIIGWACSL